MAIEDVVQKVQVQVSVDGVDGAKKTIDGIKEQIESLSGAANNAVRGAGGAGGGGLDGLNTAFKNIGITAAQSFSQILGAVTSGELSGLATMLGGPVAGAFTKVAEQIAAFIEVQSTAVLRTTAMAKEFGTTPEVIQGMGSALSEAGVSSQSFERLVQRMSQRVASDYSSMMKNIRTDNDTAESATIRLTKAQEKLQEYYGVPPETFAAQNQLIAQKELQIQVDQAQEAVREQALRSIPNITAKLKEGMTVGHEMSDVAQTDVNTLVKSFENLARTDTGPAKPLNVLKELMEGIRAGAIDDQKALAILNSEMGRMARAAGGVAGGDAERFIEFAHNDGWQKMTAAVGTLRQHGFGLSKEDVQNAKEETEQAERLGQIWDGLKKKLGAALAPFKKQFESDLADSLIMWAGWARKIGLIKPGTPSEGGVAAPGEQKSPRQEELEKAGFKFVPSGGQASKEDLEKSGFKFQPTKEDLEKAGFKSAPGPGEIGGPARRPERENEGTPPPLPAGTPPPSPHLSPPPAGYHYWPALPGEGPTTPVPKSWAPISLPPPSWPAPAPAAAPPAAASPGNIDAAGSSLSSAILSFAQKVMAAISLVPSPPNVLPPPPTHWRGGAIPGFDRGGLIWSFDTGGAVDPFQNTLSAPESNTQFAMSDPRVYNNIGEAHKDIEQAGFDPTARQEMQNMWTGGRLPGFAQGSVKGPGTGKSDSILARLSNGEFVMQEPAVRTYGENFMYALNDMRIPPPGGYMMGGMVPASSLPRLAEGGAVSGSGYSTLNLTIGDKTFSGLKAPDHVAAQLKAYAISQQTTQTGKKPSWVGT